MLFRKKSPFANPEQDVADRIYTIKASIIGLVLVISAILIIQAIFNFRSDTLYKVEAIYSAQIKEEGLVNEFNQFSIITLYSSDVASNENDWEFVGPIESEHKSEDGKICSEQIFILFQSSTRRGNRINFTLSEAKTLNNIDKSIQKQVLYCFRGKIKDSDDYIYKPYIRILAQ